MFGKNIDYKLLTIEKDQSGNLLLILLKMCEVDILVIVSTGSIRWILWFSVRYAAATRREIFGVNALRGKQQQLGSPNLQDIFIGGKLLWEGK